MYATKNNLLSWELTDWLIDSYLISKYPQHRHLEYSAKLLSTLPSQGNAQMRCHTLIRIGILFQKSRASKVWLPEMTPLLKVRTTNSIMKWPWGSMPRKGMSHPFLPYFPDARRWTSELCQALPPQRAASLRVQTSEPVASDQSVLLNCCPQARGMAQ